jgi:hypothetical protein
MSAAGYDPNMTLLQALNQGGGGFQKLARQGVAALLNSCSINYAYSTMQVLTMIHNAIVSGTPEPTASLFADANESDNHFCPPAGRATKTRLNDGIDVASDKVSVIAFPNPFSNTTSIEFKLNTYSSRTTVEIFNVVGERIATLFNGIAESGVVYTVQFKGDDLAEGIFFAKIVTDSDVYSERLMLVK